MTPNSRPELKSISAAALAVLALAMSPAPPRDLDRDGLPDLWETSQCGDLDTNSRRCDPRRQDLVLIVNLREGAARAEVEPSVERLRELFARMPGSNPDGSIGINLVVIWRDSLRASEIPNDATAYERGIPRELRGFAHGLLVGPQVDGGGNTTRPDWSYVANRWQTMAHELGHQLGLDHLPPGSSGQSPLYTSLMNYDYATSFDDDPDAVHFSTGRFATARLDESRLTESLPFPESQLRFLTKSPYHFAIRGSGARLTLIDWNRNGEVGESRVRADVNDGYAVHLGGEQRLGKAAGAPSLAVVGGRLLAVYPDLARSADYSRFTRETLSRSLPGMIVVRSFDGRSWTEKTVLARQATGDPHAVMAFGRLVIAYPAMDGYVVQRHMSSPPFRRESLLLPFDDLAPGRTKHPVLIATRSPEELWVFLWDEAGGEISYREVTLGPDSIQLAPVRLLRGGLATASPPIRSEAPIHLAYDPEVDGLALVTSEPEGTVSGRLRIHALRRTIDDGWVGETSRWTTGPGGSTRSLARPWILYEADGPLGRYLVYHKGIVARRNEVTTTWLARTVADRTRGDGWRSALMGNEWLTSRSAPAAAFFAGDIAYAVRWSGGDLDHELLVNVSGSGLQRNLVADHDDVTFIRTRGLRQSLGR